ncbi:uncharacterized protein C19orf18 homolog [Myotis lucifugus]|uniref:uncharacterized protein C19orf18 homolog n=1 Tax=Myotis lucifugus TaxID=59463 RepID=UPI0006D7362E|nr:uncharacterized protein C19orf18 homolog [Myotis lucifugus]
MGQPPRSFAFLVLFLMEWPLHVCLPDAGDREGDIPEPVQDVAPSTSTWDAVSSLHRRALVRVVAITCAALSVALVCGIAVSYVIYRLGQDEEREQLAELYENIQMPLSGDEEEAFRAGRPGEAGDLLSGNEEELAEFINSAIRSKRRQHLEGAGLESVQKQ